MKKPFIVFINCLLSLSAFSGVSEIEGKFQQSIMDGKINEAEAKAIRDEAGRKFSVEESRLLAMIIKGTHGTKKYSVEPEVFNYARGIDLKDKLPASNGVSYAGTKIPQKVQDILAISRYSGAIAYDVQEVDTDSEGNEKYISYDEKRLVPIPGTDFFKERDTGKTEDKDGFQYSFYNGNIYNKGKWTPYLNEYLPATGSMAFTHTEITPEKIQLDITNPPLLPSYIGGKNNNATYSAPQRVSSGNISAHYDENYHSEVFARGSNNQRWANNCAIMSDGSLHCLPAMRRHSSTYVLLTNQSLDRKKMLLVNGHFEFRNGIVTSVGVSGRLHKKAVEGDYVFINPLEIIKAWGFKVSPSARLFMEGRHGPVNIDPNTFLITEPIN